MAKFKPGQRVRFVKNSNPFMSVPVGTEGTIIEQIHPNDPLLRWFALSCTDENRWRWKPLCEHERFVVSPDSHLEPIIDKPELSTWDKMGFHPKDFLKQEA